MTDLIGRSLAPQQRTFAEILRQQARLGERALISAPGAAGVTYGAAPVVAARVAGALVAHGVGPGERVLVFAANRPELLTLWMGAAWAGAIYVPVNTAFRGEQLRHAVRIAGPAAVVCDADLLPLLQEISAEFAGLKALWVTGAHAPAATLGPARAQPWGDWGEPVAAADSGPGDTVAILYTSGTSGPSKAVACPHGQFFWWGVLTGEALGLSAADRLHTTLPLTHTNALNTFWQALLHGATYSVSARFSASAFWDDMRASGATVTYLLGAMVYILLHQPRSDQDRRHALRIALAPSTSRELVAAFHDRFGVRLIEGYGSTETNLVFSNVTGPYTPGTMGRPVPEFDVRIVDDGNDEVADGHPGQLLVRARTPHSVASGYFRDPEATAASWRDGWFHTGDRIVRRADGSHEFLDRIKDAIRRRGENVSSWEVEQALLSHDDVESGAVIGVPSELGEEEVMAFVVPRPGCELDPVALIRHLETRLAYFAIPRYIEFLPDLPLTENGKVKKFPLRQRGIGAGTWDRDRAGVTLRKR